MRNFPGIVLAVLTVPAVSAAVLPVGVVAVNGGTVRSVHSAPSVALVQSAQSAASRGEWTADTYNTWRGDDGEPRIQFNLRTGAGDSRWGFGVRLRDMACPYRVFRSEVLARSPLQSHGDFVWVEQRTRREVGR